MPELIEFMLKTGGDVGLSVVFSGIFTVFYYRYQNKDKEFKGLCDYIIKQVDEIKDDIKLLGDRIESNDKNQTKRMDDLMLKWGNGK